MSSRTDQPVIADSPGTRDRWFILALVASNYFTIYLHRNLINYIQPALKRSIEDGGLKLTDTEIGWLGPAWLVPYCLAQLLVGYLSDRYRRRTVILSSLMASVVALAAMGLVRNFPEFVIGRILLGIAQACAVPAMASMIADCFSDRTRSKAVGLYLFSYNCALIAGSYYGGKIADIDVVRIPQFPSVAVTGWRMAHFAFAGIGAAVWAVLWLVLREPERTERHEDRGLGTEGASVWSTVWAVFRVRTFIMFAIVFALGGIVSRVIQFWLPRYYHDIFHETIDWGQKDASYFATVWIQVGTMAGLFCGGPSADWAAKRSIRGRISVQLIGLLAIVPSLWIIGSTTSIPWLAVAMFGYGYGLGLYQANLWTTTFEVIDPAARATAVGLLNLSSGVLVLSWVDPVIGMLNDAAVKRGETIFDTMLRCSSVIAAVSCLVLIFGMYRLLPRDIQLARGNAAEE